MDEHSLRVLEFGNVLGALAGRARLDATREAVARLVAPTADAEVIALRRDQCNEMVGLLQAAHEVPIEPVADVRESLGRARIADSSLSGPELVQVAALLRNAAAVRRFFKTHADATPLAGRLAAGLLVMPEVLAALERALTDDGSVRDNASDELRRVRGDMATVRHRIERKLEAILHNTDLAASFAGDRPTQRGGRLVLPMKASHWTAVGGLVHDRSQTGQTFFVEPPGAIELGNELQNLAAQEEAEVRRILLDLTSRLRPWLAELEGSFDALIRIDLLAASARLAQQWRLAPARIADPGEALELVDAWHPALATTLSSAGRAGELVPLGIRLDRDLRTLAITGSNTGGKTVALKTVGMAVLMAQSGLHVPARRATLPVFDDVLVDIGDEQSIEQSLSTFSGHMSRIIAILRRCGDRSLVLLDELGSGTDPAEGGALACAVLMRLAQRRATTLVTTHLREVKIFCHEQAGMQNAAMEFDARSLRPTFRLVQGEPGQSHALAIAARLGMPEEDLIRARGFLTDEHLNLETLLGRMTEERRQLRDELETARRERQAAQAERKELQDELSDLKKQRKGLLKEAYAQASGIVDNTRREMQKVLREAGQKAGQGAEVEGLRKQIKAKREKISKGLEATRERKRPKARPESISAGATVWVETFRSNGTVQSVNVKRGRATVLVGGLTVDVKIADLSLPEAEEARPATPAMLRRAASDVPIELNLIGMRVAEALANLERFVDQAAMAGYTQVTVVHGRGTGALMKAVREHLEGNPLIAAIRSGNEAEGGIAVTVAALK